MMGSKCVGLEARVKKERQRWRDQLSQMLVGLDVEFEWGQ